METLPSDEGQEPATPRTAPDEDEALIVNLSEAPLKEILGTDQGVFANILRRLHAPDRRKKFAAFGNAP